MNKELSIVDILNTKDISIKKVDIEVWDGYVYVKSMSATERAEIEEFYNQSKGKKGIASKFRKEIIKRTLCDCNGTLLINDDQTLTHLMNKNAEAIETIVEKACEVNGFREQDVDEIKKK